MGWPAGKWAQKADPWLQQKSLVLAKSTACQTADSASRVRSSRAGSVARAARMICSTVRCDNFRLTGPLRMALNLASERPPAISPFAKGWRTYERGKPTSRERRELPAVPALKEK